MTTTPTTVEELLDYWPGNIPFKGSLVSEDGSCMCAQGQALHFLDKLSPNDLRSIDQANADKRVAELFGISRAHSVLLRIVNDRQNGAPTSVIRNPEQVLGDQAQVVLAFWRHLDQMDPADWVAVRAAAGAAAREADGAAAGEAAGEAAGAAAGEVDWEGDWEVDWAADWAAAMAAAEAAARAAVRAGEAAGAAAGEAARAAARAAAREAARAAAMAAAGEVDWAAVRAAARAAAGAAVRAAAWASSEIQGAAVMRANNHPFFFLPFFGFADPEAVMAADREQSPRAV